MSNSAHVNQGISAQNSQVHVAGGIHSHGTVPNTSADLEQRLVSSLRFSGMNERYYNVHEELYNTCEWLLNTQLWLNWQQSFASDSLPRLLWIKGHPETGKSTLMRFAHSRHIPRTDEIVLSHFFNARGGELERSIVGMQRTLISQLLDKLRGYANLHAQYLESILPTDGEWTRGRLHHLFTEILRSNRHYSFTLFIDALDECDEGQARYLINNFSSLLLNRHDQLPKTRICLASRYYPNVIISLDIYYRVLQLEAEAGHGQDLAQFIRDKLFVDESVFQEAYHGLLKKANRCFLWCDLVITELNQKFSDGLLSVEEVKLILQQVPPDMSGLFQRLLGMGPDSTLPNADANHELRVCMQWMLFAQMRLRPYELCQAIFLTQRVDKKTGLRWDRMPPKEGCHRLVIRFSRGLIEVNRYGRVQVIHESVRDFFLGGGGLKQMLQARDTRTAEATSHDLLKRVCWEELLVDNDAGPGTLYAHNDFSAMHWYAERNVLRHAEMARGSGIDQAHFLRAVATKCQITEQLGWRGRGGYFYPRLRRIWLSIAQWLLKDDISHLTQHRVTGQRQESCIDEY